MSVVLGGLDLWIPLLQLPDANTMPLSPIYSLMVNLLQDVMQERALASRGLSIAKVKYSRVQLKF